MPSEKAVNEAGSGETKSRGTSSKRNPQATKVYTVSPEVLRGWVKQRAADPARRQDPKLNEVFESILWAANEYVPSEGGSICLGGFPDASDELVFVASFGEAAPLLPGTRLRASQGITGKVFRSGRPQLRNDVTKDRNFYAGVDEKTHFVTHSILAVPIFSENQVVGVVSLINRLDKRGFRRQDLRLMEIFCGYLTTSIQNLVDASIHLELSQRDYLSGLRNDRYFYQKLVAELESCERYGGELSLIFLDLDRFKAVVDTHGHLVGSQVLAEVGQMLARVVTHPGVTLARYGGDEYVAILPGADSVEALDIAETIRRSIVETVFLTEPTDNRPALNLQGQFSASIGVASYRDCDFSHEPEFQANRRRRSFIRIADEAMYEAKRLGKNRVCLGRKSSNP